MRLLIPLFFFAFAGLFADASVSETIESTHPVNAGASFSLDNVNGRVTVETWDRPEVRIVAEKSARNQEDLDAIEIQISASDDRVSVKTKYNRKEGSFFSKWNNSGEVEYTITVPAGIELDAVKTVNGGIRVADISGDVSVSTINGSISATGLRGNASIHTVNGNVKADFASVSDDQQIRIDSVNGRSEVALPSGASFGIKASTVHGSIRNEFGLENTRSKWGVGNRLNAQLGDGGANVDISTVNGGIRVSKSDATM